MGASEIAKALKIGRASVSRRQTRLPPDVGDCDPGHLVRPPTGTTSLRAIAAESNRRGIRTPRGTGEWQAGSVAQLLARLK
jgi:hypothetical protein